MALLEPERHTLTIYPSEILEGALYQGSVSQASDYRIIKNLHITHVVNATANCPDAFPDTLCYLRLRLSDDAQQDLVEALPLASRFINTVLKAEPASWVGVFSPTNLTLIFSPHTMFLVLCLNNNNDHADIDLCMTQHNIIPVMTVSLVIADRTLIKCIYKLFTLERFLFFSFLL